MSASTTAERTIVQALRPVVGSSPVILCGSRATGEASISSDYDLFVLLKPARIPFAIPRLRRVAQRLEQRLGAEVSLNPLPRFRLEHPGRTLLAWKIRQEGKVLWPSEGFELPPPREPALSTQAASSYALSGLRFLIAELTPGDLAHKPLGAELRHAVRKALLHASQLTLIRSGRYASGLRDAIELLERAGASEYSELAHAIDRPETWLRVRDLLSAYISEHREPFTRSFVANGQYVALSALRGDAAQVRALASRASVRARLSKVTVSLAGAVRKDGTIDQGELSKATDSTPGFLQPNGEVTWTALRDVLKAHWANADPLVGL
jgi:predicted nucleotidyltransferase